MSKKTTVFFADFFFQITNVHDLTQLSAYAPSHSKIERPPPDPEILKYTMHRCFYIAPAQPRHLQLKAHVRQEVGPQQGRMQRLYEFEVSTSFYG